MLEKEKNILLGFAYAAFIAIGFTIFVVGSKVIPTVALVGVVVLLLYFYVTPSLAKKYYSMHGVGDELGFSRFIPFYNEVMVFSTPVAIAYLITLTLLILSVVSVFLKPSIIASVFGDVIALQWANGAIVISLFLIVLFSIIRGIGYSAIVREVNSNIKKISGVSDDKGLDNLVIVVQYVLLFIPVFRAFSLAFQLDRINKIVVFLKMTEEEIYSVADSDYEDGETYSN